MSEPDHPTRRSVLKAAGVAGAVGLGAATPATAALESGDCATVTRDSTLYSDACPLGEAVAVQQEGTKVQYFQDCTDADGETWAEVASGSTGLIGVWMDKSNLEETTC